MIRQVEARQTFAGPWWLAIVVLEEESRALIEPALRELQPVEVGPMGRAGTVGRMSLRWGSGGAGSPSTMAGELRIAEVDGNVTGLTLSSHRHVAQKTLDRMVQRLADRIEAAVAREIGTPAA